MKDIKYFSAFLIPVSAYLSLGYQGFWSYGTVAFAFGLIPILEIFLPKKKENLSEAEAITKGGNPYYDLLLYANLPILYTTIFWYLSLLKNDWASLAGYEIVGLTLSVGIVVGTCGINVGHELGHRNAVWQQWLGKLLLLPALYMHFFIEHNRGHHKYVATDEDPASARYGEWLYLFWLRSLIGGYWSAWSLEKRRLNKADLPFWSLHNEMVLFHLIQGLYLLGLWLVWGWHGPLFGILAGLVGILLLETINYIEHYGLRRKQLPSGRFERVMPWHSWNANYELGRIMLYELTRHSDHHFLANKKYQLLDHHDEAPELPLGYPASMLMALVPPLWLWVMNPRVRAIQEKSAGMA